MAGSSIFVKYGLKSGGGAPFLRRIRNAFEQLETRTRTGATGSQRQQQHRTCNCSSSLMIVRSGGTCNWRTQQQCHNFGWISRGPNCNNSTIWCDSGCSSTSHAGQCIYNGIDDDGEQMMGHLCCAVSATVNSISSCSWSGWSGYYNVSSCSPASPGCSNGAQQRQCRTVSVCNFGAYTSWSNVSSCSAVSPSCSNGALQRECQTVYSFREQDWSSFEEAETCTPSNPSASAGAVQVECIAN